MARDDDLAGMPTDDRERFARERDQFDQARAAATARLGLDALVGLDVEEARSRVERADGEFVTDDGPIATKLDLNRVIATVVGGRVRRVHVG